MEAALSNRPAEDQEKIVAQIIPELWSMAAEFLQAKKDDIESLFILAKEKKFEEMSFLAHRIKGAAGSYGMDRLSQLAGYLFNHTEKKDLAQIDIVLQEMREYVKKVVLEKVK